MMYNHVYQQFILKKLLDKNKDNLNKIEFLNEHYKGGKSRKKTRKISKKKNPKRKQKKNLKKIFF